MRSLYSGVLMAFFIFLTFSIGMSAGSAVPYNTTDNVIAIGEGDWCGITPIDPKIACSESDPNKCIMAYYEANSACTRGVKVFFSVDGFQTPKECTSAWWPPGGPDGIHCFYVGTHSVDWSSFATSLKPNFHLPFDVVWSGKEQGNVTYDAFYIAVEDTVYRYLPGSDSVMCDGCARDIPDYYTTYTCGGTFTCRERTDLWVAGWDNGDVEKMFVAGFGYHEGYSTPYFDKFMHYGRGIYNISSNSFSDFSRSGSALTNCKCQWDSSGCPSYWYSTNMSYFSSPFQSGSGFAYNYTGYGVSRWDAGTCAYTRSYGGTWANFTSPSNANALHHEFGGSLYGMNVTNGVYSYAISGDYASFGTPSLIYQHDSSINEVVNWSDSDSPVGTTSASEYIVWYRSSNSTGDGVYVYQNVLDTILISHDEDYNLYATLVCQDKNYSTTATSDSGYLRLSTPCSNNENNTITIFSPYEPATYTFNVSYSSVDCPSYYSVALHYEQLPYDFEVTVRSLYENGVVVPSANVEIVGVDSNTTDSNGKAILQVNPLSNIGMRVEQVSSCSEVHSVTADVLPLTFKISKSGYVTYTDNNLILASYTDNGVYNEWDYVTKNTTRISVAGTILNISLESAEGIVLEPCSYYVEVNGSNVTKRGLEGGWTYNSTSYHFPVLFRLEDNRSYWNETISVLAPNGEWFNQTLNVSANETYDVVVIIEHGVQDLPCDRSCDCPDSLCIGKYWYKASGCSSDVCQYQVTECVVSCDSLAGCYEEDTSIPCTYDSDCPSKCLGEYSMEYGVCGSDGYCKNSTIECKTYCNNETQFCKEMENCRFGNTFNVDVWYYKNGKKQSLLSGLHTCTIDNIGERVCVGGMYGGYIPKSQLDFLGITLSELFVTPSDLTYATWTDPNTGEVYYNFSSVSVYCNSSCDYSYEVCDGPCDTETGECINTFGSIETSLYQLLPDWLHWMLSSLFLWTMFALIVGGVLTYIPTKISPNAQPTPQFGLAGIFVVYLIGIPFKFVDPIIGLMILIGIGLYLAKMISSSMASS